LISACAYCQGNPAPFWSDWTDQCPPSYVSNGAYLNDISSGTAVPAWAYVVVTNNQWSASQALAAEQLSMSICDYAPQMHHDLRLPLSDQPESLAPGASATNTGTLTSTGSQTLSSPSPTSTFTSITPLPTSGSDSSSSGKKNNNIGAIVGGTVGGILAVIAIVVVGFFTCRGKKGPSMPQPNLPFAPGTSASPHNSEKVQSFSTSPYSPDLSFPQSPMKLYDPNDPSTFPENAATYFPTANAAPNQDPRLSMGGPPSGPWQPVSNASQSNVNAVWQTVPNASQTNINGQWQHESHPAAPGQVWQEQRQIPSQQHLPPSPTNNQWPQPPHAGVPQV